MVMLFIKDMLALLRVTVRRLSILVILAALVLVAVWFTARFEIVEWAIRRGLYETPTPTATYEILEVRTDRVILGAVAIDGLLWADRIEITYSLRQLLDDRVSTITIRGAVLQLVLDDAGNPTGPLTAWTALLESNPSAGAMPPFDAIVLDHGIADVTTPWMHVRADITGAAKNSLTAIDGAGAWQAQTTFGTAKGTFSVTAPHADGAPVMALVLDSGELGYHKTHASDLSGNIELAGGEVPKATLNVNAALVQIGEHTLDGLSLVANWENDELGARIMLGNDDSVTSAAFAIAMNTAAPQDPARVSGSISLRDDLVLPFSGDPVLLAPARLDLDSPGTDRVPRPDRRRHRDRQGRGSA